MNFDTDKLIIDVEANEVTAQAKETAEELKDEKVITPTAEETALAEKYMKDVTLTPEEETALKAFIEKIDLTDSELTLKYGAACQEKLSKFTDTALEGVKTKDLGEVSGMLSTLVTELKGFSLEPEKKGLFGLFAKGGANLDKLKNQYVSAEKNVDKIELALMSHQNQLSKDVVMMDKMYESNLAYLKELSLYIIAGKEKLAQEKDVTLAKLREEAEKSGLAEDAQKVNDYAALCERFEKKLYDLELTRNISIQMAPQIRLIQNNDVQMVERIQSTLANTIPLWKNQMVLTLGMAHADQATVAQRQVTDLTNELLKKNAETLKQGTIAVATESERAVVDIETLKETNQKLIETFDEVIRIQAEGREKRANAENELAQIEGQLKAKLLEIKGDVKAE